MRRDVQPQMDRLALLSTTANRTRVINEAFGTHLTPAEIARTYADEDIELLLIWSAQPAKE